MLEKRSFIINIFHSDYKSVFQLKSLLQQQNQFFFVVVENVVS